MLHRLHNKYHGTAPSGAVYIGRGSPYGNPYIIGEDGSREEVIDKFEKNILPGLDLKDLAGKHLVCFCKPKKCHGESILKKLMEIESDEDRATISTGYPERSGSGVFEAPAEGCYPGAIRRIKRGTSRGIGARIRK